MVLLARWCFRHRLVVLLLWVVALGGAVLAGRLAGSDYSSEFKLPASESVRAAELMQAAFPEQSGDTDVVVWQVDGAGTVKDAAVSDRVQSALDRIAALPDVGQVVSPYGTDGAGQISSDGRTAYAQITYTRSAEDLAADRVEQVVDTATSAAAAGLRVEVGGPAAGTTGQPPSHLAEFVGLAAAALVLFLAFGSFLAMLLPLVTALFGVGLGLLGVGLLSHAMDVPDAALLLSTLIGLGVGIDYALFIVSRHRAGLREGLAPEEAAIAAARTSGRSVLFAGAIVCVSLLGMFAMKLDFLNGVAVATSLTVLLSVVAALTLLPALLGLLGTRVLNRRQRRSLLAAPEGGGADGQSAVRGFAVRWADTVQRRPKTFAAAALVLVAVLSLPAFALRLGMSDQGTLPESNTARRAYDMLADAFGPGFNGPLQLVVRPRGEATEVPPDALQRLVDGVGATPGVAKATAMPLPGQGGGASRMAVVQVIPTTSPQDAKTDALIDRLRTGPAVRDGSLEVLVGGGTALNKDLATALTSRLPLFLGAIVALGSVLLLVAFRSLAVPLLAAVLNVAATGTALGITVALFQWGWGTGVLGIGKPVPITSFLPVIMIAMLFGLAMDYQVFLTGRMREEWLRTGDARQAAHAGLVRAGGVIISAALIMISVFGAFVLSGDMEGMLVGAGLAGAIAVDALVLRAMLVPAVMTLLGTAAWWTPARNARRSGSAALSRGESEA
ncbi:MMPL family transporter [Actinomadura sp. 3N508]|uniref:MMPL family transporter n=1 Tax=Actinomadura sp. 3N508 TaxID=3375153 RepID=UPI00379F872E